jgi:hypothetical protein
MLNGADSALRNSKNLSEFGLSDPTSAQFVKRNR